MIPTLNYVGKNLWDICNCSKCAAIIRRRWQNTKSEIVDQTGNSNYTSTRVKQCGRTKILIKTKSRYCCCINSTRNEVVISKSSYGVCDSQEYIRNVSAISWNTWIPHRYLILKAIQLCHLKFSKWDWINARDNRRGNQELTIQKNWQHWVHKIQYEDSQSKQNKTHKFKMTGNTNLTRNMYSLSWKVRINCLSFGIS
jgi:hypothetical protein